MADVVRASVNVSYSKGEVTYVVNAEVFRPHSGVQLLCSAARAQPRRPSGAAHRCRGAVIFLGAEPALRCKRSPEAAEAS